MPLNVAEALRDAAAKLAPTSDTARLDAELLMAHALQIPRSDMLLHAMHAVAPAAFAELIERRTRHEPVAYITGRQGFYGLDLEVGPAVLIPRADSETLIEAAREACHTHPPQRILDLGAGSGALLLAALTVWPGAEGVGVERDRAALTVAQRNAARSAPQAHAGYAGQARFVAGDWHVRGWADGLGRFDLILCNPPYVEHDAALAPAVRAWEPAGALFAGPEGLDDYRVLIPQLSTLLTPGGVSVVEIGATQARPVNRLATEAGFTTDLRRDLGGRPRALVLRLGLGKE